MRKQSGFTMVELIVVVALVAILTAIGIPNYISWLPGHRLRAAADDINTCFQLAKLQAVRENAPVAIEINAGGDELTVFVDDGAGGGNVGDGIRNGAERLVKFVEMPTGIDMTSNRPWLGYTNRGFPLNNQFGSVFLQNTRNDYLGVRTNSTGNPRYIRSNDGVNWN